MRAEFSEHLRAKGKLDRGDESLGVLHLFVVYPIPLLAGSRPLVVLGDSDEQRDGEGVEIELLQNFVHRIELFTELVNPVEVSRAASVRSVGISRIS